MKSSGRRQQRESIEVEMCGWTSLFGDVMLVIQLAHGNHGDLGIHGDVSRMMGSQVKTGVSKAPFPKPRLNL